MTVKYFLVSYETGEYREVSKATLDGYEDSDEYDLVVRNNRHGKLTATTQTWFAPFGEASVSFNVGDVDALIKAFHAMQSVANTEITKR